MSFGWGAGLGSLVGGGNQAVAGTERMRQRKFQARTDRKESALKNLFQQQLAGDPLFALILGQSQSEAEKGVWNERDVFRNASRQIDSAMRRRTTDQLQQLAGFGYGEDSDASRFLSGRLQRSKVRQLGAVDQMLAQKQIEANQLQADSVAQNTADVNAFTGLQAGNL